MTRAGLRYHTIHLRRRFELRSVQDMVTKCRRHFFGRSKIPILLEVLHLFIHFSFIFALYMLCFFLPAKHLCNLLTWYKYLFFLLSIMLFFLILIGTYIISLTIYTLFFNHSIVVPLFHPFLHPLTGGFLFPLRLLAFLTFSILIMGVMMPAWASSLTSLSWEMC
ncbi:hypothetical protein JOM56_013460 [Amanita muscaria]